jgi:hypothetical protein
VRIGLLSDMGGPYRDVGGPGNRVAVELAIEDFGGSVLGRPIEVLQGDDQNKPDEFAGANGSTIRASTCLPMVLPLRRASPFSRSAARRSRRHLVFHHRRLCSATRWNGMGDLPVMVLA